MRSIKYIKKSILILLIVSIIMLIVMYNNHKRDFSIISKTEKIGVQVDVKSKNSATNLKIFGTDTNNNNFSILADSASESSNVIVMNNVKAQLYLSENVPSLISAGNGRVFTELGKIALDDGVKIIINNQYSVRTKSAEVFYKKGMAKGNNTVEIVSPIGTISAFGFEAINDKNDCKINLIGRVKANIKSVNNNVKK